MNSERKEVQQAYYKSIKDSEAYKARKRADCKRYRSSDEYKAKRRQKNKERYSEDCLFKLKAVLRVRLNEAIKNNHKAGSAVNDLGCSISELKTHLESKFQPDMTWNNHTNNGWHIDHIIPLDSFDLNNPEELKKACHYSNLQPLWAQDNVRKSNHA